MVFGFSSVRYNKVKERSESMTAEEVEEIMRKKISESFQVRHFSKKILSS